MADFFSDAPPEARYDMYIFSWWPNFNHPQEWAWTLFHSDASGSGGGNAGFYSNDEANAILDDTWMAPLTAETTRKMTRPQQILTVEDPAWIPLYQERMQMVYRKDVVGMALNPAYVLTLPVSQMHRG